MSVSRAYRLVLVVALAACGPKTFDPPSEEQRVLESSMAYSPAAFDTIDWPDRERMLVAGAAIFGADCRDCHGPLGEGGTAYAAEHGLEPPSFAREAMAVRGRRLRGSPGRVHGTRGRNAHPRNRGTHAQADRRRVTLSCRAASAGGDGTLGKVCAGLAGPALGEVPRSEDTE